MTRTPLLASVPRSRPTTLVVALAAPLAALCLVLAGCSTGASGASGSGGASPSSSLSSSSSGSGAGSRGGACSLLPLATANLVLAELNLKADSAAPQGTGSCGYTGQGISFSTTVKSNQSAADWTAEVAAVTQDVGDAPEIPSLGDRAVGAIRLLAVQKGSTIIELNGQVDNTGSPAQNVADLSLLASAMLNNVK